MSDTRNKVKPPLLKVREAAILLRLSRAKIYYLIEANSLDAFKLGSDWRIRTSSVEKFTGEISLDVFERGLP